MNSDLRLVLQIAANIFGAGFVVILGFTQFADFFVDHSPRHICGALAWWVLVPVLILRTAVVSKPPLANPQFVMDWVSVGWAVCLLFGIAWAIIRMTEKRRETQARKRLGLETREEKQ